MGRGRHGWVVHMLMLMLTTAEVSCGAVNGVTVAELTTRRSGGVPALPSTVMTSTPHRALTHGGASHTTTAELSPAVVASPAAQIARWRTRSRKGGRERGTQRPRHAGRALPDRTLLAVEDPPGDRRHHPRRATGQKGGR